MNMDGGGLEKDEEEDDAKGSLADGEIVVVVVEGSGVWDVLVAAVWAGGGGDPLVIAAATPFSISRFKASLSLVSSW